jgi:hypothetical protein
VKLINTANTENQKSDMIKLFCQILFRVLITSGIVDKDNNFLNFK